MPLAPRGNSGSASLASPKEKRPDDTKVQIEQLPLKQQNSLCPADAELHLAVRLGLMPLKAFKLLSQFSVYSETYVHASYNKVNNQENLHGRHKAIDIVTKLINPAC